MYNFEKLRAWQEAIKLAEMVYRLTKKFPKEEKFALIDQLKRAVTSISLNIAEGSGSRSKKVFVAHLEIAIKSLYETISILKLGEKLFKVNSTKELDQCVQVNKLLQGLLKSIKSNT
ncbi:four helix bundle protein [bacterium]|nr:four helix bundle protein [bacterium]